MSSENALSDRTLDASQSLRSFASDVLAAWRFMLLAILVSLVAAILIVRLSPPTYMASMSLTKAQSDEGLGLSFLGEVTGKTSDTSIDELRATLESRALGQALANGPLRAELEEQLAPSPPNLLDRIQRFLVTTVFGQRRLYTSALEERVRDLLREALTLRREESLIIIELKHRDRAFAERVLQGAVGLAEQMMTVRQRSRAIAYRQYLAQHFESRSSVITSQVTERLLQSAMGEAMRLSSPSAKLFVTIDGAHADKRPVAPAIGLITAACLGLGIATAVGVIILRRLKG